MKRLVFVILITFIPAIFTGCQKGDNIVEKLTPEPTLEEKYDADVITMFENQTAIPSWKEYLIYAEKAHTVRKQVSMEEIDLEKLKSFYTVDAWQELNGWVKYNKSMFDIVQRNKKHGRSIFEVQQNTRKALRVFSGHEHASYIHEHIDKCIVAVYFGYHWENIKPAIITRFMYMSTTGEEAILAGKIK